jgi:hypothetical protein
LLNIGISELNLGRSVLFPKKLSQLEQQWSALQERRSNKENKEEREKIRKGLNKEKKKKKQERGDEPRRSHRTLPLLLHAACPRPGHLSSPHKHTSKHTQETTWKAGRRRSSKSRARSRVLRKPPPFPPFSLPSFSPSLKEGHRPCLKHPAAESIAARYASPLYSLFGKRCRCAF